MIEEEIAQIIPTDDGKFKIIIGSRKKAYHSFLVDSIFVSKDLAFEKSKGISFKNGKMIEKRSE